MKREASQKRLRLFGPKTFGLKALGFRTSGVLTSGFKASGSGRSLGLASSGSASLGLFATLILPAVIFGQVTPQPGNTAAPMQGPGGPGRPGYSYQRPGAAAIHPGQQTTGTPAANSLAAAQPAAPPTTAVAAPSLLDLPAQSAKVDLSGGRLTVQADNSSLTAILRQVSISAGMTIDGLSKDVRVFGTYGPGDPRDILSSLLDGTGYNVVMFGRTSAGTPSQLTLTTRGAAPPKGSQGMQRGAVQNQEEDEDPQPTQYQDAAPPAAPPPPATPNPPNGGVRSPQQMLQELQQMHQQQQQEQQSQPQAPVIQRLLSVVQTTKGGRISTIQARNRRQGCSQAICF